MKHWQQYNKEEQLQILDIASATTRLPRLAIEKDWWVTMVLKALTYTEYASLMSFKGGTSLSKGWRLINRFSEDVDISLKRESRFSINGTSNTQLAKARRKARHYIVRELPEELNKALLKLQVKGFTVEPELSIIRGGVTVKLRADTHPSSVYVNYNSILQETSAYVQPRVKIEISCLSMNEPVEKLSLQSLISESIEDVEDIDVIFSTVVPTRTFLEKIFLLHEEFQKENPRSYRMSRHLYDLEKIMDSDFGYDALADRQLYMDIVRHRSIFNKIPDVNYDSHHPDKVDFIPSPYIIPDWEKDYRNMRKYFIYEKESLDFDSLMGRIKELQERIRRSLRD